MAVSANTRKGTWGETLLIVIEALAIAMVVRTFLYQPFNIPSGSMKETLLIGDYLFVSKLSYGYSRYSFYNILPFEGRIFAAEPKRGDVVVFKLPRDNSTDYIKRVIGLPGDQIDVRGGVVLINGKEVPRRRIGDFVTQEDAGPPRPIPAYEETLTKVLAAQVAELPEDKRGLVPDALTTQQKLDWIAKNAAILKAPAPFDIGAGSRGGSQKPVNITAEQHEMAVRFGMSDVENLKNA